MVNNNTIDNLFNIADVTNIVDSFDLISTMFNNIPELNKYLSLSLKKLESIRDAKRFINDKVSNHNMSLEQSYIMEDPEQIEKAGLSSDDVKKLSLAELMTRLDKMEQALLPACFLFQFSSLSENEKDYKEMPVFSTVNKLKSVLEYYSPE
jgi:hypothetical protein